MFWSLAVRHVACVRHRITWVTDFIYGLTSVWWTCSNLKKDEDDLEGGHLYVTINECFMLRRLDCSKILKIF